MRRSITAYIRAGSIGIGSTSTAVVFLALLLFEDLVLQEFKIFAENFDCQTVKVDSLTACFVHSDSLLLDLFVLKDDELLDGKHLIAEALNCHKLIIWLSLLDLEEDFEDLVVLVLNFDKA